MSSLPLEHSVQSLCRLINSDGLDSLENDVKTSLTNFLSSLNRYKTNLAQKDDQLQEKERLGLTKITDENSLNVIRNLKASLDEKKSELEKSEAKCLNQTERIITLENALKQKTEHIEKLSSLLILKEENIQTQENELRTIRAKMVTLETNLTAKNETTEQWRQLAQNATGKMREQQASLKVSEEMNHDLRKMLDKKIETQEKYLKNTDSDLNETPNFSYSSIPSQLSIRSPIQRVTKPEVVYKIITDSSQHPIKTVSLAKVQKDEDRYLTSSPQADVDDFSTGSITCSTANTTTTTAPRVVFRLDDNAFSDIRTESGCVGYPAPHPTYSKIVEEALDSGRIHDPVLWRYFIRECVHFYYDLLPTTDCAARNSYYNIGKTLFEKYPCIAKEGPNFKTPWTYFNTCLSSRLRNERFAKKRSSEKHSLSYIRADSRDDVMKVSDDVTVEEMGMPHKRVRILEPDTSVEDSNCWQNEGCHL